MRYGFYGNMHNSWDSMQCMGKRWRQKKNYMLFDNLLCVIVYAGAVGIQYTRICFMKIVTSE